MSDELSTLIEREGKSWPGVTIDDAGRGGLQFRYSKVELGHLHGSSFADRTLPQEGPQRAHSPRASLCASTAARVGLGAPENR